MKKVKRATAHRKCQEGSWEAVWDFEGKAHGEFRDTATGRSFTVAFTD